MNFRLTMSIAICLPPIGIMPAATLGRIARLKLDFCDLLHGHPTAANSLFSRGANGRCWPVTAAPVGDNRGSFRGLSGRRVTTALRQLMTPSDHLLRDPAAMQQ